MIIRPSVSVAIWSFTSRLVVHQGCLLAPTTSEVQRTNEHQAEIHGCLSDKQNPNTYGYSLHNRHNAEPCARHCARPCEHFQYSMPHLKTTRALLTVQLASPCALYLHLSLPYDANRPSTQDRGMAPGSSKARIEPLTILLELPRPANRWHDYADMATLSTAWRSVRKRWIRLDGPGAPIRNHH